ncbi:hypothetical protein TNCV_591651 [Trichonephila clavipes]|nr:hypothetical protein TNCV_591651 [Trichonephila clavipes]
MPNFIEGFGYVQKKYTRGLVLGEATMNQLRYSEQLMNCRALGSKTALLRNNKVKSSVDSDVAKAQIRILCSNKKVMRLDGS